MQREPDEERPSLDPEALAPHKEKIKVLEKELAVLDNFLSRHFGTGVKLKNEDFVEVFKNLNILDKSNKDAVAAALSDDILERAMVYIAHNLQYSPLVMGEILTGLRNVGNYKALEEVYKYVETLHSGIIENKKKILWQLIECVGLKKSAAIFEKQDKIKEEAYPHYLNILAQEEPQIRRGVDSGDPEAERMARTKFNVWYEDHKEMFLTYGGSGKIHSEVNALAEAMDDKRAYEIIEKHLVMTPRETFELLGEQNRKNSE